MNFYSNKLALITGGSSGIGLALAKGIASRGGDVAILARHEEMLEKAEKEIGACKTDQSRKIYKINVDITDPQILDLALTKFKSEVGIPDIVINSAGVAHPGKFTQLKPEIFHWMMDVNYFGTVNVLKSLLPEIQARHSGSIVNISSIAGFIGVYGYSAYGASKFAVSGLSDVLRSELKPYGVKVSIVYPPDTDTPQLEYESQLKPFITKQVAGASKLMTPEQVAKEVLDKVSKGTYVILPGSEGKLLFTAHNLLGRTLYPVLDKIIQSAIGKIQFGK